MLIASDVDDVLTKTLELFCEEEMTPMVGRTVTVDDFHSWNIENAFDGIERADISNAFDHFLATEGYLRAEPRKDMVQLYQQLAAEKVTFVYVTSRPKNWATITQTENWLREHQLPNNTFYHITDRKADYVKRIGADFIIEDNFGHALACGEVTEHPSLLLTRPHNRHDNIIQGNVLRIDKTEQLGRVIRRAYHR